MRSTTLPMLETYPQPIDLDLGKLEATIDALVACSEAGTEKGQFAMFGAGDALTVSASGSQPTAEPKLEILLLGGRPIRHPVVQYGPS